MLSNFASAGCAALGRAARLQQAPSNSTGMPSQLPAVYKAVALAVSNIVGTEVSGLCMDC